jgi:hypothetical protein
VDHGIKKHELNSSFQTMSTSLSLQRIIYGLDCNIKSHLNPWVLLNSFEGHTKINAAHSKQLRERPHTKILMTQFVILTKLKASV